MKKLLLILLLSGVAMAQKNIINVPAADLVDKGSVYTQAQTNYQPDPAYVTHEQSLSVGLGHNFEIDVAGFEFTRISTATGGPGFKWAPILTKHFEWFLGDLTKFPGGGNLFYDGLAFMRGKSRYTIGVQNGENFYKSGNRTDAFLGWEYQATKRLEPQCDWYGGSYGYSACSVDIQITKRFDVGPGYQWGNSGLRQGNHTALVQIGYTFK